MTSNSGLIGLFCVSFVIGVYLAIKCAKSLPNPRPWLQLGFFAVSMVMFGCFIFFLMPDLTLPRKIMASIAGGTAIAGATLERQIYYRRKVRH